MIKKYFDLADDKTAHKYHFSIKVEFILIRAVLCRFLSIINAELSDC